VRGAACASRAKADDDIDSALNLFQWSRVAVFLFAIFAIVIVAELVTELRKRVI
jgi:hypothetical protein